MINEKTALLIITTVNDVYFGALCSFNYHHLLSSLVISVLVRDGSIGMQKF